MPEIRHFRFEKKLIILPEVTPYRKYVTCGLIIKPLNQQTHNKQLSKIYIRYLVSIMNTYVNLGGFPTLWNKVESLHE